MAMVEFVVETISRKDLELEVVGAWHVSSIDRMV